MGERHDVFLDHLERCKCVASLVSIEVKSSTFLFAFKQFFGVMIGFGFPTA